MNILSKSNSRHSSASLKSSILDVLFQNNISLDSTQLNCIEELSGRYVEFFSNNLFYRKKRKGVFITGEVGCGKTMILNAFFRCVDSPGVARWHFHAFLQYLYVELNETSLISNPLARIGEKIAKSTRLLVLDELFFNDIVDAKIVGGLLKILLDRNVFVVVTSNFDKVSLFANEEVLKRCFDLSDAFNASFDVCHVGVGRDYRKPLHEKPVNKKWGEYYVCGKKDIIDSLIFSKWGILRDINSNVDLGNQRKIFALGSKKSCVWLDFNELFTKLHSTSDFLSLVSAFSFIILTDVVALEEKKVDFIRRVINFMDILYDSNVSLVCFGEIHPEFLWLNVLDVQGVARARSRMGELKVEFNLDGSLEPS